MKRDPDWYIHDRGLYKNPHILKGHKEYYE